MGCNFYTTKNKHIGKRSAAGLFCWDCGITLCKEGNDKIHYDDSSWYEKCPKCNTEPVKEIFSNTSVGRELGFNKQPYRTKEGVQSCSSFTWAIPEEEIKKIKRVVDEYGKKFTKKEFEQILLECPIQYYSLIGRSFC